MVLRRKKIIDHLDSSGSLFIFWITLIQKALSYGYPENARICLFALDNKLIEDQELEEGVGKYRVKN
jgi:hypothetical protein